MKHLVGRTRQGNPIVWRRCRTPLSTVTGTADGLDRSAISLRTAAHHLKGRQIRAATSRSTLGPAGIRCPGCLAIKTLRNPWLVNLCSGQQMCCAVFRSGPARRGHREADREGHTNRLDVQDEISQPLGIRDARGNGVLMGRVSGVHPCPPKRPATDAARRSSAGNGRTNRGSTSWPRSTHTA